MRFTTISRPTDQVDGPARPKWMYSGARGLLATTLAALLVTAAAAEIPADTSPEEGFVSLFNGKDLTGWNGDESIWSVQDGAITGCMSINNIVGGVFRNGMLGYWIGAPHVRRGYMGEALQLALRHAFRGLGLHRVEANIMPHNDASIALVKRAGFRLEGLSRKYLKIAGRWSDHERWALLAEEWRPRL